RFWKALDLSGADAPFAIHYIGVDRQKKEPSAPVTNNDIRYVPTFIVYREGREVGRIVEESPHGIEKDLLALLTGQAQGLITTRTDLLSSP
ncbi:MAG TPA: thioredoxin family protein, partial [Thermoanaerobaculia bacterium]|nr:thioredoxin family protein [Thermoanaerobaculia bacterium]